MWPLRAKKKRDLKKDEDGLVRGRGEATEVT